MHALRGQRRERRACQGEGKVTRKLNVELGEETKAYIGGLDLHNKLLKFHCFGKWIHSPVDVRPSRGYTHTNTHKSKISI